MTQISELITLDDLATPITEAYGSSTQVDRNKAYDCVNRAVRIISRKGRWPFFAAEDIQLNTVTNQEFYYLPANMKVPEFLHMRNPAYKLKMTDLRSLRRAYPNNVALSGTPRLWRIVNFDASAQAYQIGLWPIPNGVYNIYIDADILPNTLSDKSDLISSVGIPQEMFETLIDLSIALMYEKYDDIMFQQKKASAMAQLEEDYARFTNHLDEDLRPREYHHQYSLNRDDPTLPPQYS